jgi:hypothetical protein
MKSLYSANSILVSKETLSIYFAWQELVMLCRVSLLLIYTVNVDCVKFEYVVLAKYHHMLTRIPSGESIWGSRSKKDRLLKNQ